MKTLLKIAIALILSAGASVSAQTATPVTTQSAAPAFAATSPPIGDAKAKRLKQKTESAPSPSQTSRPQEWKGWSSWQSEVLAPLVRLAGIALILGALILALQLPNVLKPKQWSERTIVALAIIFTFCAAALLNTNDQIFGILKDVTLVVVGFYFGAARGDKTASPSSTPLPNPVQGAGAPQPDMKTAKATGPESKADQPKV